MLQHCLFTEKFQFSGNLEKHYIWEYNKNIRPCVQLNSYYRFLYVVCAIWILSFIRLMLLGIDSVANQELSVLSSSVVWGRFVEPISLYQWSERSYSFL